MFALGDWNRYVPWREATKVKRRSRGARSCPRTWRGRYTKTGPWYPVKVWKRALWCTRQVWQTTLGDRDGGRNTRGGGGCSDGPGAQASGDQRADDGRLEGVRDLMEALGYGNVAVSMWIMRAAMAGH